MVNTILIKGNLGSLPLSRYLRPTIKMSADGYYDMHFYHSRPHFIHGALALRVIFFFLLTLYMVGVYIKKSSNPHATNSMLDQSNGNCLLRIMSPTVDCILRR